MRRAIPTLAAGLLLYAAAAQAGNSPSALDEGAREAFARMLPSDMSKFVLHPEPRPFRDETIFNPDGKKIDLTAFEGQITVLNFWAVWCNPCRVELPGLDALQEELGDEGVKVVTVSVDRGGQLKAEAYLTGQLLDNLEPYWDEKSRLAKQMGVLGIPVTAILGPDAREIGRLLGEADWNSEEIREALRFLVEQTGG